MSDLQSLLERLKGATGPDRELDARLYVELIAKLRQPAIEQMIAERQASRPCDNVWLDGARDWQVPRYSASIDAALALVERVLPDVMWRVGFDPDDGSFKAELVTAAPACRVIVANHDTPALALLQALIASKSPSEPSA